MIFGPATIHSYGEETFQFDEIPKNHRGPTGGGLNILKRKGKILLMVQKSGDHHPTCMKPVGNNGISYHISWFAGLLNHQQ